MNKAPSSVVFSVWRRGLVLLSLLQCHQYSIVFSCAEQICHVQTCFLAVVGKIFREIVLSNSGEVHCVSCQTKETKPKSKCIRKIDTEQG